MDFTGSSQFTLAAGFLTKVNTDTPLGDKPQWSEVLPLFLLT